jgi:hypothetical protein
LHRTTTGLQETLHQASTVLANERIRRNVLEGQQQDNAQVLAYLNDQTSLASDLKNDILAKIEMQEAKVQEVITQKMELQAQIDLLDRKVSLQLV